MDPCKPELRTGAREASASPAWLAAPTMNARDITKVYQSLCRDWSSTGLFLFDNLQMSKSEISSEHDYLQGRYCEQDFILL